MGRTAAFSLGLVRAAEVAIAMAILLGGGCELGVGDEVPPFECVSAVGACPDGQVCAPAQHRCVLLAGTCLATGCAADMTCDPDTLECARADAGLITGEADSEAPADSSPGADDSSRMDGSALADATTDGPTDAGDGGDSSAPEADASPDVSSDAPGDGAESGAADASADTADGGGSCRGLACRCSGATDCASGLCGDQLTVTSDLYQAAGSASFCTQPCCTSSDCDPTTVCFGTGAGGSYCVPPAWISRATAFGTKAGGAACSADSDCRSGLCATGGCADTCCSTARAAAECGGNATCNLGAFPGIGFDTHYVGFCGASAACPFGSPCTACRQTADCSGLTPTCAYLVAAAVGVGSSQIVAGCTATATGAGTQGSPCSANGDCVSAFCDPVAMLCTNVCFADTDCTMGWHCLTELVSQNGGGKYSVLRCGS
jgi:hypothetical protein